MAVATEPATGASAPLDAASRLYFPQLDGLRFVAFLLVYLFHGGWPQFAGLVNGTLRSAAGWLPVDPSWTRHDWGGTIQANGWTGVQLFFVLSGYLIAMLLIRERQRFGRVDLKAFWVRRILRIWPLYYAVVVIGFFLLPWLQGSLFESAGRTQLDRHLIPFSLFLGNWSMGLRGPVSSDALSVLWSVCVEEQFYLFVPLLIVWGRPAAGVLGIGLLMGGAIAWRWWLATQGVNPLLFGYSTPTQADSLLSGVLLALVMPPGLSGPRGQRVAGALQVPVALILLTLLLWPGLARGPVAMRVWGYVPFWLAAMALIAVLVLGQGAVSQLLAHRWLVWLGRISYGLYMVHELTLEGIRRLFEFIGWFPNREAIQSLCAFALTVAVAAASYYGLERPFLRLKHGWTRVPSRPIE